MIDSGKNPHALPGLARRQAVERRMADKERREEIRYEPNAMPPRRDRDRDRRQHDAWSGCPLR